MSVDVAFRGVTDSCKIYTRHTMVPFTDYSRDAINLREMQVARVISRTEWYDRAPFGYQLEIIALRSRFL